MAAWLDWEGGNEHAVLPPPLQALTHQSRHSTPFPLSPSSLGLPHPAPCLPPLAWKPLSFEGLETGETWKQTPPVSSTRRAFGHGGRGVCGRMIWTVNVRNTPSPGRSLPTFRHYSRTPQPSRRRGDSSSVSVPSQKPSLGCLINRKYLLAGGGRGAVWKRELAPSLLGGPQLLASFP